MFPTGKLVYTRNQLVVLSGNVQSLSEDTTPEGNPIPLPIKEIGTTEIFATNLIHSPNGRFVTVVEDGEYIIPRMEEHRLGMASGFLGRVTRTHTLCWRAS